MNDVEERVVVAHLYTDSSCVEDALRHAVLPQREHPGQPAGGGATL